MMEVCPIQVCTKSASGRECVTQAEPRALSAGKQHFKQEKIGIFM